MRWVVPRSEEGTTADRAGAAGRPAASLVDAAGAGCVS